MKKPRRAKNADGPQPFILIEEAVHLLRSASAGDLALYLSGAVPWVLGGLFFWAHVTWFAPGPGRLLLMACGLAALFVWLKTTQAAFCARLLALRMGDARKPDFPWAKVAVDQLRLQVWGLIALPVAALLAFPLVWVGCYYQNLSVFGHEKEGRPLHASAWSQALLWPAQLHLTMLLVSVLWLYVWVNLAVTVVLVPELLNALFGMERIVYSGPGFWMNTTFLASVTALSWLAVDPLIKALHVLRVFHGRSRRTGEDLRMELASARIRRTKPVAAVACVLLALAVSLATPAGGLRAAEAPASPAITRTGPVASAELDRAIDEVLQSDDYAWRLRPLKDEAAFEDEGLVGGFFRDLAETARSLIESARDGLKRFADWVRDLFPERKKKEKSPKSKPSDFGEGLELLRLFLYGLVILVVGLAAFVGIQAWRQARRGRGARVLAESVAVARPDLNDENVQAAQLPLDGWLALAREKIDAGDWRLALRALYLATLAKLGGEGLVSLAKFKTNLDYERELRRRAPQRGALLAWFRDKRSAFEATWYGRAPALEAPVRDWLVELEEEDRAG